MGWKFNAFCRELLRQPNDPWQEWLSVHALELRPDGRFRYRTVLLMVARQNGKTEWVKKLIVWLLFTGRIQLAVGSAHKLGMSRRTWEEACDLVAATPELARMRKGDPRKQMGLEALRSTHGNEYTIAASTKDAARGIPGCDFLHMDELRTHVDFDAWSALTKTQMARPNALCVATSNAGDDTSAVLNMLHATALAGTDPTLFLAEYSAPDGCPLDDIDGARQANPSLGRGRLSMDAINASRALDPPAVFRCLDIESHVLTMSGWNRLGDLRVGDSVKNPAGQWVDVLGVSPEYAGRDCYRVTLSDGRSVVCDAEHRWPVRVASHRRDSLVTAEQMLARGVTYAFPSNPRLVRHNFALVPVAPLDGPDVPLPIDPYFLGLWLGDGCAQAPWIAMEDRDLEQLVCEIEHRGLRVTRVVRDSGHCYRVSVSGQGIRAALVSAGLLGNKHVPDAYLTASLAQRRELLRGLMDSDGTCNARGAKSLSTSSDILAAGYRTLIRSFGYSTAERTGYRSPSLPDHHLAPHRIQFVTNDAVSSLARKNRTGGRPGKSYAVKIISIDPVESRPVKCIQVDSPDSLFLVGDLVPTKNTEVLCQRVMALDSAVDADAWLSSADAGASLRDMPNLTRIACVDVSLDGNHVTLACAAALGGGRFRVELVAAWDDLQEARAALGYAVAAHDFSALGWFPNGPGAAIGHEVREAAQASTVGIFPHPGESVEIAGMQVAEVCQAFAAMVAAREVLHPGDPLLNAHVAAARRQRTGDTWRFMRRDSGHTDALYAAAGAVHLARKHSDLNYDVGRSYA